MINLFLTCFMIIFRYVILLQNVITFLNLLLFVNMLILACYALPIRCIWDLLSAIQPHFKDTFIQLYNEMFKIIPTGFINLYGMIIKM